MMVMWIMNCVTSTSFAICVNGEHKGFFQGARGLRQGDPMSPYLFTMVMELFTLILKRQIGNVEEFQYHWGCDELQLTHLCFADDLILFCHGDSQSVEVLKRALDEFSSVSGLFPSMDKCTTFFGHVSRSVQEEITNIMPFNVGSLPIRYLGVPLLSSSMQTKHCVALIDKVKRRIFDWKSKSLSFAGRMQFINSVLSSLQVYWASMFVLPKSVSQDIERLIRGFLWCQGEFKRGKAKVNWKDVCRPKRQGGLGIKSLHTWNIALMSKHVWNVVNEKRSIWVRWIKTEKVKTRNFWDYHMPGDVCWSWRKIIECRDEIRKFVVIRLGDGHNTSAWFDNWHPCGPLGKFIESRDLYAADMSPSATVADIVVNGEWCITDELRNEFSKLFEYLPPLLIPGRNDRILWKTKKGKLIPFSVHSAWCDLSEYSDDVKWAKLVWFSQCIPGMLLFCGLLCKVNLGLKTSIWLVILLVNPEP